MSLKCAYHLEREASSKCEKCGKLICLECKMVYRQTVHGGSGDSSYAYSKRYEYCPVCYYDAKAKIYKYSSIVGFFTIGMLIFMLFVVFLPTSPLSYSHPAMYIPLIIISIMLAIAVIVVVYLHFIRRPKKVGELDAKKEEFLRSIKTPTKNIDEEEMGFFCTECGNKIDPDASICSYCGRTVKK